MPKFWLLPKHLGDLIKGHNKKSLGLVLGMARVTVEDCIEKISNRFADEKIIVEEIQESLVKGLQRHVEIDEPEEEDVDSEESEEHKFIAGALDVSGSTGMSYGTKAADDMGMQIHEGSAVTGQVFEDVDEATLEDET